MRQYHMQLQCERLSMHIQCHGDRVFSLVRGTFGRQRMGVCMAMNADTWSTSCTATPSTVHGTIQYLWAPIHLSVVRKTTQFRIMHAVDIRANGSTCCGALCRCLTCKIEVDLFSTSLDLTTLIRRFTIMRANWTLNRYCSCIGDNKRNNSAEI